MTDSGLAWWGRGYVSVVVLAGMLILGHSIYSLYAEPISWNWFVLALLTLLTGSATVKLPSVPATISISETFVFTSALLYGPAAGTLTVALDALVISLSLAYKGHPAYRLVFNIFALPAALWVGAHLFFWTAGVPPLSALPANEKVDLGALLRPLILFAGCYFALNSWLIALAIAVEKRISPFRVWKENFAWLSLNYFGGASVAALLVTYQRDVDYRLLAIVLPLLAVLYFTFSTSMGRVEDTNKHLSELNTLYMSTIETLAMAIDAKDQITHGHIRRVQHYAVALAKGIGIKDPAHIRAIEAASLLHDMGKLAVPEYILNKPGPLTPAEFEKMKLHASVGADILSAIDFPYPVVPIVRHHHESWDGSGYPDGIKGTDIPIGARILSVVDCFDALTSDRPYRPRLPDSDAIAILMERRGRMYHPLVVDTFLHIYNSIEPLAPPPVVSAREGFSAIARSRRSDSESRKSKERLDEINASTEETVALYDLATALSGKNELIMVADIIGKHLRRMVPASSCVLYMFDEKTDELVGMTAVGEHAAHFLDLRIPRGQRLTGWIAANKQSVRNSDPVLDLGDVARSLKPPLKSCLGAPIVVGSDIVGVLTVYSNQQAAFSKNHQRILEAVARQVGPSIRGSAPGSNLSELPNRTKALDQRPQTALASTRETDSVAIRSSILVIELNASSSSSPGTLERLSELVIKALRRVLDPADVIVRFNEISVIALLEPGRRLDVAEILQQTWRELSLIDLSSTRDLIITVGCASSPEDGEALQTLIDTARKAAVAVPPPGHPPSVH